MCARGGTSQNPTPMHVDHTARHIPSCILHHPGVINRFIRAQNSERVP